MGFFKALGKMIQGRPVFEVPAGTKASSSDQTVPQSQAPPVTASQPASPAQPKTIPTFMLQHCETRVNGNMMDVVIWATNMSDVDIEIDKCVILDTKIRIDRQLGPGRAHEITIYRGPIPKTNLAHKANIFYKSIRANEYFRVDFMVEYNHESDGTYTVEELHPEHYEVKEIA